MMRTTKLIIANSLIALLVVVTFASVLLNRFHAQDLRAEQENLERCMGTFRELLSPEGAPFGVEGGGFWRAVARSTPVRRPPTRCG